MRILYMGTPQFAVAPLKALLDAGHQLAGVVTRIDKPAGRGRQLAAPPVKIFAVERGLPVYQPKRVRDPEFLEKLRQVNPDAIVVAAYGQILPAAVLHLPPHGCINIHASLLPAYRGAAPVNWAIIRGERETGVTIMQMDEGMDTGAILMQEAIPIEPVDTAGTVTEKLSHLGASLIIRALPLVESGKLKPNGQDNAGASLAPLLKKEDGRIDWTLPAVEIGNRVRGFTPWPGAYTYFDASIVKILKTEVVPGAMEPGRISAGEGNTLDVGTGNGLLRIITIQPSGKKPMSAAEFLRGHRNINGKKFEIPISKS